VAIVCKKSLVLNSALDAELFNIRRRKSGDRFGSPLSFRLRRRALSVLCVESVANSQPSVIHLITDGAPCDVISDDDYAEVGCWIARPLVYQRCYLKSNLAPQTLVVQGVEIPVIDCIGVVVNIPSILYLRGCPCSCHFMGQEFRDLVGTDATDRPVEQSFADL